MFTAGTLTSWAAGSGRAGRAKPRQRRAVAQLWNVPAGLGAARARLLRPCRVCAALTKKRNRKRAQENADFLDSPAVEKASITENQNSEAIKRKD